MADSRLTVKLHLDSDDFERDVRRLRRRVGIPSWCYSPWRRAFVMGNALAAPLLVLLYAVTR